MDEILGRLGEVKLRVAAEPRVIIQNGEQVGLLPAAARSEDGWLGVNIQGSGFGRVLVEPLSGTPTIVVDPPTFDADADGITLGGNAAYFTEYFRSLRALNFRFTSCAPPCGQL